MTRGLARERERETEGGRERKKERRKKETHLKVDGFLHRFGGAAAALAPTLLRPRLLHLLHGDVPAEAELRLDRAAAVEGFAARLPRALRRGAAALVAHLALERRALGGDATDDDGLLPRRVDDLR